MKLPQSARETLVEELDDFLAAYSGSPDAEGVVNLLVELLEGTADEYGIDDLLSGLEESGALDTPFAEVLEAEMSSNDEFEYTGEEIVSLFERICDVEWTDDDDFDGGDWEEDEEEDEEEEEEEEL